MDLGGVRHSMAMENLRLFPFDRLCDLVKTNVNVVPCGFLWSLAHVHVCVSSGLVLSRVAFRGGGGGEGPW